MDLIDKTRTEFKSNDEIIAGDIHIGGGETHAIEFITKIMKEIQIKYPAVKYHVYSGNSSELTCEALIIATMPKGKQQQMVLRIAPTM